MMNDPISDIHQLKKSARYEVCRSFMDFYKNDFREGEVLTFIEVHFLPYHGGYTIVFKEKTLYLHEQENADILDSFSTYIRRFRG